MGGWVENVCLEFESEKTWARRAHEFRKPQNDLEPEALSFRVISKEASEQKKNKKPQVESNTTNMYS